MVLCSATLAAAAETATPEGGQSLACDMQPAGVDQMDFKCPFVATGEAQRLRFRADFVGSHDDTSGSITAQLNGAPLVCDEGSATQLTGEFGEVSLDCRFQVEEKAGTKLLLGVAMKWFHAQYTNADFRLE
jgi:hypothetical protein